ncbi:hypothetical protein QVD17_03861 [Tagetes erecta]|uniref:C2H2-type domain-containing protein n=1 Tax=Tagetes erecta TaxID=13708 RepID=A0AAD8LBP2_TARER|nr:hypothetical protein QVD17_03861 [Tagetes erecta]
MEDGSRMNCCRGSGGDEEADGGNECKTCGKRFHSFRARSEHEGIHKLKVDDNADRNFLSLNIMGPVKSSSNSGLHRCKLCMKAFESGPALGGHMTRHRKGKDHMVVTSTDDDYEMAKVAEINDEEQKRRRDLILAAKEWRLYCVSSS